MAVTFNYNQTIEQAKLLDELANDMQSQCCKALSGVGENVEAAWSGESAKAYLKHIRGVETDMQNKAKYLREVAEFLRSAAKKIRAAEEAAKQAANRI